MDTPSSRLVAAAQAATATEDRDGRCLVVRRPGALDRLRLFKAAGPSLVSNAGWMGMATLACSVIEIDGVPVPATATEAQVEALVARLGDAGLAAVAAMLAPQATSLEPHAKN